MTKQQIRNCVIAIAILAAGIIGIITTAWPSWGDPLKGAVLSGSITLLTWIGGLALVFHQLRVQTDNVNLQIRKQSENTIAGNRYNEKLKLKKDVYEEADVVVTNAEKSQDAFRWCVDRFLTDIDSVRKLAEHWVPQTNILTLRRDSQEMHDTTRAVVALVAKWRIVDQRLELFLTVFAAARDDVQNEYSAYLDAITGYITADESEKSPITETNPSPEVLEALKVRTAALVSAIIRLNFYTHDLRTELQNALLGDLFDHQVGRRLPGTYAPIVIRLDRFEELQEEFAKHPTWVKYNKERGISLNTETPPV
jgi:hypothetical protein